jgi:hypothetical protein
VLEWRAQLVGELSDLGALHHIFESGDPIVIHEENSYWLRAQAFSGQTDHEVVRQKANEIVSWMNGAVYLHRRDHRDISTGGLVATDESGKREHYLHIQSVLCPRRSESLGA